MLFLLLFQFFTGTSFVQNRNFFENQNTSTLTQFHNSTGDENQEVVGGSVNHFTFTPITYIGFGLIFLILIFFLVWKFISSRRHLHAGEINEDVLNQNNIKQKKKHRSKKDEIEIEIEEESEESDPQPIQVNATSNV